MRDPVKRSICGADCGRCELKDSCPGCATTDGRSFGRECFLAACCRQKGCGNCNRCPYETCEPKVQLISEFNSLGIKDLPAITRLYALRGAFVNMEYTLPDGQKAKLLDDDRIYLGTQMFKPGSTRCYGLAADEHCLVVCEYDRDGTDPELTVYRKRRCEYLHRRL